MVVMRLKVRSTIFKPILFEVYKKTLANVRPKVQVYSMRLHQPINLLEELTITNKIGFFCSKR